MLSLRFPKVWIGLGWLLVAGVSFGSLLPAPNFDIVDNDKLVHFSSYFLLTIWFCGLYGKRRNYIVIAAVLIGLGALLDLLQGATSTRHFDIYDILANTIGVLLGFVLALVLIGGWCQTVERWLTE